MFIKIEDHTLYDTEFTVNIYDYAPSGGWYYHIIFAIYSSKNISFGKNLAIATVDFINKTKSRLIEEIYWQDGYFVRMINERSHLKELIETSLKERNIYLNKIFLLK